MTLEMVNRLDELRKGGTREGSPEPLLQDTDENEFALENFFSTVEMLSRNIDEIENKLEEIEQVQNDIITKPAASSKLAKERHTRLMEEVKVISQKVHRGLKQLDQEIKSDDLGPNRHLAEFRIKKGQFAALTHKLKRVMLDYNKLEEEYRERSKDLIKRQLKTVDPSKDPTDERVEELLESQDLSVFTQDILVQTAHKREALNEVQERKREILQLEENIQELHDMFYDMMLLVDEQGDMIDVIEKQVENAAVYVEKGTQNVKKAVEYSRSNRRLRLIICAIVTVITVVILVIIGIIVAAVVAMKQNSN